MPNLIRAMAYLELVLPPLQLVLRAQLLQPPLHKSLSSVRSVRCMFHLMKVSCNRSVRSAAFRIIQTGVQKSSPATSLLKTPECPNSECTEHLTPRTMLIDIAEHTEDKLDSVLCIGDVIICYTQLSVLRLPGPPLSPGQCLEGQCLGGLPLTFLSRLLVQRRMPPPGSSFAFLHGQVIAEVSTLKNDGTCCSVFCAIHHQCPMQSRSSDIPLATPRGRSMSPGITAYSHKKDHSTCGCIPRLS